MHTPVAIETCQRLWFSMSGIFFLSTMPQKILMAKLPRSVFGNKWISEAETNISSSVIQAPPPQILVCIEELIFLIGTLGDSDYVVHGPHIKCCWTSRSWVLLSLYTALSSNSSFATKGSFILSKLLFSFLGCNMRSDLLRKTLMSRHGYFNVKLMKQDVKILNSLRVCVISGKIYS